MAAPLAQLVELRASVAGVVRSNPTLGALFLSYFNGVSSGRLVVPRLKSKGRSVVVHW